MTSVNILFIVYYLGIKLLVPFQTFILYLMEYESKYTIMSNNIYLILFKKKINYVYFRY